MKKNSIVLTIIITCFTVGIIQAQAPETLHDFTVTKINGDTMDLSVLAGKRVLVVNTASFCAYTPQYTDLQTLYSNYGGGTNFEIIGFPCNDFGNQEPNDDSTINIFCNNYNVTFQMMSKISITALDTAEVYKWLQLLSRNGVANAPVLWNFNKYLIDEAGHWINHFPQSTNPLDPAIVNWLTTLSVPETAENNFFNVFPNPANNEITINNKLTGNKCLLKIFDTAGRKVLQSSFFSLQSSTKIDVSGIAAGVYSVQLISDQEVFQTKLVKQ